MKGKYQPNVASTSSLPLKSALQNKDNESGRYSPVVKMPQLARNTKVRRDEESPKELLSYHGSDLLGRK